MVVGESSRVIVSFFYIILKKFPIPGSSSLSFFSFIWFKVVSSETIKFFDCFGKAVEKIRYRDMYGALSLFYVSSNFFSFGTIGIFMSTYRGDWAPSFIQVEGLLFTLRLS
jgi:hypothetical protein